MLSEKHSFPEQALENIFDQQSKEKITSLQKFGEMLYQCLLAYKEEYAGIFE